MIDKSNLWMAANRRNAERLMDCAESTMSTFSGEEIYLNMQNPYHYREDISMSDTQIKSYTVQTIAALIMIKMKLKILNKMITTNAKVKRIKGKFRDMFFMEGIEFVNAPSQAILQLEELISRGVDIHGPDDK
jgi:hypothetical protein